MAMHTANAPRESAELEEESTAEIVREALSEAREFVSLEIELAKSDARAELRAMKLAFFAFAIAAGALLLALALATVAIVWALGAGVVGAAIAAVLYLGVALVAGGIAWQVLPARPLDRTRERWSGSYHQLKERTV